MACCCLMMQSESAQGEAAASAMGGRGRGRGRGMRRRWAYDISSFERLFWWWIGGADSIRFSSSFVVSLCCVSKCNWKFNDWWLPSASYAICVCCCLVKATKTIVLSHCGIIYYVKWVFFYSFGLWFLLALAAKKMEPSFVFRTLMAYLTLTAIYFIQSIFC